MKNALRYIIHDIKQGENVDLYVTLFLSLALAILGVIGIIQTAFLSAGILATLSILAYSTLTTRRTLSELSQMITSLQPPAESGLTDRHTLRPLSDRMKDVRIVWLMGPTLVNIWSPNAHIFFEKVRNGGEVRLLIFRPESAHLPIVAEQMKKRPDGFTMDSHKTLDICRDLVQGGLGTGKFEVRLTEMLPGYSMVISNPSQASGHLVVEYLGYHSSLGERPHLELDASKQRRWFDYYLNQYTELWNSAIPYQFDDLPI